MLYAVGNGIERGERERDGMDTERVMNRVGGFIYGVISGEGVGKCILYREQARRLCIPSLYGSLFFSLLVV